VRGGGGGERSLTIAACVAAVVHRVTSRYDVRYEDDDLETAVESARIRVSVGFIYNPQALRKIVPNRPRASLVGASSGARGSRRRSTKVRVSTPRALNGSRCTAGKESHMCMCVYACRKLDATRKWATRRTSSRRTLELSH
jgi:hypothetical protein